MDTLPVELIEYILSFLPLVDRVKCESINRKINYICKDLWNQQTGIDENELPPTKWITEFQTIRPDASDKFRSDFVRWQLTLKCPRIKRILIDDEKIDSNFFIEQVPHIQHLTVTKCNDNFVILNEAKRLQTIVLEESDCNEYKVIQHLTSNIKSIEGPSICDPWINKWDEFFEHYDSGRFQNLEKLTVVICLQTVRQLDHLSKLGQLTHIRFLVGDDFDNNFVIKYLQLRGSKLKGLELFHPHYFASCRSVYAAVLNSCLQIEHLGIKGHFHCTEDYDHFKKFLFDFKSLTVVSLNISRTLTQDEVFLLCDNNQNLRQLNYTYYMPSISPIKLKICEHQCDKIKLWVDNYNSTNRERMNIIFNTSKIIKKILSNCSTGNKFANKLI